MRILVTGASGLLGVNLALEAARQHQVIGIANQHAIRTNVFEVRSFDLLAGADPGSRLVENLLADVNPDWVIHCAALANMDVCELEPEQARKINVEIPRRLAQGVRQAQAYHPGARLLHVSTDAVFDGQRPRSQGGYLEEDQPNPMGVYAQTKLQAERAVLEADPSALVARVNLMGWSISGKRSLAEFFYTNLKAGSPVRGFDDVYFCPLLVNDLAHIFLNMLEQGLSGLYHVFSRDTTSKYDFGVAVARRFGFDPGLITPVSVQAANLSAARSPNLVMRTDKLSHALARPLPSWREGLDKFFDLHASGYPQTLFEMSVQ